MNRNCWLSLPLCCAVWFGFNSPATSHPIPPAEVQLSLESSGSYILKLRCDAAALVMQTTPGHLGPAAESELKAIPEAELAIRREDAKRALVHYLELNFDQKRSAPTEISFPTPDAIRASSSHGTEDLWPEIQLRGVWPADAQACSFVFPASLGKVKFRLSLDGVVLLRRQFASGESTGRILLENAEAEIASPASPNSDVTDTVGLALAGILLVYLGFLYFRRADPSES